MIQKFWGINLKVKNGGTVVLGRQNYNSNGLYIGVNAGQLKIGDYCFFNINGAVTCKDRIEIGNNCKFGNNVVIVDHDHNYKNKDSEFLTGPIIIGNNVWVGANAVILRNTKIGDNSVVGAGTVVKGDFPPDSKIIGYRPKKTV
ncbi:MAG: acyltransferase [Bacillota bacterium]|nr:acyltransferase [Bacillota bacterium]